MAKPTMRDDLQKTFHKIACSQEQPSPEGYWKSGIYDMQISWGKFVVHNKLSRQKIASSLAQKTADSFHNGFVFGMCSAKKNWFASMPAAAPVKRSKNSLHLKAKAIKDHCRSLSIRFSSHKGGTSRLLFSGNASLIKKGIKVNTKLLYKGSVSVTCHPKSNKIGPQLWHLIPTRTKEDYTPPFLKEATRTNLHKDLLHWINQVREDNLLPVLKPLQLNLKTSKANVLHAKSEYERLKSLFAQKKRTLIGENRVIGRSFDEISWMLWNSPSHRDLLLSSQAKYLSLDVVNLDRQTSITVLMAK